MQKRDNILGILYPGKIGFFGGHRGGNESFLQCAVRELREELSYEIPAHRFEYLGYREGPDLAVRNGISRAEYFLVREVPIDQLTITEGTLHVQELDQLDAIQDQLTPAVEFGLDLLPKRIK